MGSDRSSGLLAALTGALVLAMGVLLAGCGGGDDSGTSSKASTTATSTSTTPPGTKKKTTGTAERGARRCTKTAFLAALLADVAPLPFEVTRVRCEGSFARSRFVARGCADGQTADGIPCGSAKIAAWRLGAKRWRLIAYADTLTCGEVRKEAGDFPQSLCD